MEDIGPTASLEDREIIANTMVQIVSASMIVGWSLREFAGKLKTAIRQAQCSAEFAEGGWQIYYLAEFNENGMDC